MAWYWIVCIAFGYLLLGAIIVEVWDIIGHCDEDLKIGVIIFWPPLIVVAIVLGLLFLIHELGKFLVNTILTGIENTGDFIYTQCQKHRQKKAQKASRPENKKGCSKEEIDDIDYDRRKR